MISSGMEMWRDYRDTRRGRASGVIGDLRIHADVESPQLGNRRDLLALLPSSYGGSDQRYPVLYMHDGQNLFDPASSFAVDWRVGATMERLAAEGTEAIVIGVPNAGRARIDEYSPFRGGGRRGGDGDAYLAFLVETVKPLVDGSLRTLPGPQHTGLVGSSLGGLISLYGLFAHPAVFGLCGALSPSLRFGRDAIFRFVSRAPRGSGRIYLDVGTREAAHIPRDRLLGRFLSRRYAGRVRRMRELLEHKGYRPGADLLYVEENGAHHGEAAWARRLPDALRFLLGRRAKGADGSQP